MESALTVKGQATIPKAIRDHLRLKPGDRVKFFIHPDGSVVLLPKLPVSALRGIVKSRRGSATIDQMNADIRDAAAGVARRPKRR
jgi:AbrB family looped-hinge helix DNA binding protein